MTLLKTKFWKEIFTSLFIFLSCTIGISAQRAARADLNEMYSEPDGPAKVALLADYIKEWLLANQDIIGDHIINFGSGIHNTNNFLPWHRVHVQQLEDFLLTKPNGGMFVPLPKWEPSNVVPPPMTGTVSYPGQADFPMNTTPNIPLPALFGLDICNSTNNDAGIFSDFLEDYHDNVHATLGGTMGPPASPRTFLFWPWHAWVDEIWYRWENQCGGTYSIYDLPDHIVDISGTVVWNSDQTVKGQVVIGSGSELKITNGAKIYFADSWYNASRTAIIVKSGGKLTIDGGTLTGIGKLGTQNANDPADNVPVFGIHYNAPWEGIVVEGGGYVEILSGSVIEHARTGIKSTGGGKIQAVGCKFRNNRISVEISDYPDQSGLANRCHFTLCEFINDQPLRDAIWTSSLDNGSQVSHPLYHHGNHGQSSAIDKHVSLRQSHRVLINSCTFFQEYFDEHSGHPTTAIYAEQSSLHVDNSTFYNPHRGIELHHSQATIEACKFEGHPDWSLRGIGLYSFESNAFVKDNCLITDWYMGIYAANGGSGPVGVLGVEDAQFQKNFRAIELAGADYSQIKNSTFYIPTTDEDIESFYPAGIVASGAAAFNIADNRFFREDQERCFGILVNDSEALYSNSIIRNDFGNSDLNPGPRFAIQTQNNNLNLQIFCNQFHQGEFPDLLTDYSIGVKSGELADQGTQNRPSGNSWYPSYCLNIIADAVNASNLIYYCFNNTSHVPNPGNPQFCSDPEVIVNNIQIPVSFGYCVPGDVCEGLPWPCELGEIETYDEQRQELANNSSLSIPEKNDRDRALEWKQLHVAQNMVRKLVLADSILAAATRLEAMLPYLPQLGTDQQKLVLLGGTPAMAMGSNTPVLQQIMYESSGKTDGGITEQTRRNDVHREVCSSTPKRAALPALFAPITRSVQPQTPAGIEQIAHKMVNVYPNPVSFPGAIYISVEDETFADEIVIRDFSGKLVLIQAVLSANQHFLLLPDHISPGMFSVQLRNKGLPVFVTKLVIIP